MSQQDNSIFELADEVATHAHEMEEPVKKTRKPRVLTDDQRKVMLENLRKGREKKALARKAGGSEAVMATEAKAKSMEAKPKPMEAEPKPVVEATKPRRAYVKRTKAPPPVAAAAPTPPAPMAAPAPVKAPMSAPAPAKTPVSAPAPPMPVAAPPARIVKSYHKKPVWG